MMQRETTMMKDAPQPPVYLRAVGETDRTLKRFDPKNFNKALVTLAPVGADLNDQQLLMAEQFRLLRTRVKALAKDLQLKTILITSALPGEGKTTVSANLAGSLSHVEGLRVLLVDFDLRRPTLHTMLGVSEDGHPSALASEASWRAGLRTVNRRLDVILSYRPHDDPDRLLQSERLPHLLAEAKNDYDIVILDSAPLLAVADTQSLIPLVDGSLFVLNADRTPITAARDALDMMRDKVAGCIVNRVRELESESYYRSAGYGYGYSSKVTEDVS